VRGRQAGRRAQRILKRLSRAPHGAKIERFDRRTPVDECTMRIELRNELGM
jgi:hypothetical protein